MNITSTMRHHVNQSWMLLKVTYGLFFLIIGVDKFFNVITSWSKLIHPIIFQKLSDMSVQMDHSMMILGAFEIVIGLLILTQMTRIGAYIAAIYLFVVAFNLLAMGTISTANYALIAGPFTDVALKDIVLGIGALVLAYLTTIHTEIYAKK